MKPCHTCQHRRFGIEHNGRTHAGVWRCAEKGLRFGYQWEFEAGENMPGKCADALVLSA